MSEKKETVEVRCPDCGAKIELSVAEAEKKMSVRCPKGHEVPLVKML
jgi:DNA-directed RNA polymerase subunit RPC12/RpoP